MRLHIVVLAVIALAEARADAGPRKGRCRETSNIVGYRQCTRFGSAWSTPAWVPSFTVDVGTAVYRLSPDLLPRSIPRGTSGDSNDGESVTAFGPTLRLAFAVHARYYAGVEASVGSVAFDPNGSPGGYVRGGGVAGVQSLASRLGLAAELAVGHDLVLARRRAIEGVPPPLLRSGLAADGRVRASVWMSPWISLGGSFGVSLVHRGELSVGVSVAFHGRSYDGRR